MISCSCYLFKSGYKPADIVSIPFIVRTPEAYISPSIIGTTLLFLTASKLLNALSFNNLSKASCFTCSGSSNNRTYTNIKELTFDERIDEIARLIAGNNITEKTIEHAHEIIELAQCD